MLRIAERRAVPRPLRDRLNLLVLEHSRAREVAPSRLDSEIIAEYVKLTQKLTQNEAARRIDVSQKTISEWRAGKYRDLQTSTRAALVAFLAEQTAENSSTLVTSSRRGGGVDIARQIDHVNSLDEDGRTKAWLIAEIASAYRSSALDQLAVALRIVEESSSLRGQYVAGASAIGTRPRKVAEPRPEDDLGKRRPQPEE